jgi:hypothetical protein
MVVSPRPIYLMSPLDAPWLNLRVAMSMRNCLEKLTAPSILALACALDHFYVVLEEVSQGVGVLHLGETLIPHGQDSPVIFNAAVTHEGGSLVLSIVPAFFIIFSGCWVMGGGGLCH